MRRSRKPFGPFRVTGVRIPPSPPEKMAPPAPGALSYPQALQGFEPARGEVRACDEHPSPDANIPGMFTNTCGMFASGLGCSSQSLHGHKEAHLPTLFPQQVSIDCTVDGHLLGKHAGKSMRSRSQRAFGQQGLW